MADKVILIRASSISLKRLWSWRATGRVIVCRRFRLDNPAPENLNLNAFLVHFIYTPSLKLAGLAHIRDA